MLYADLLPLVLEFCTQCPDEIALRHIHRATRNFCDKTLAWQQAFSILSVAGERNYEIPTPLYSDVAKVLLVDVGGFRYDVLRGAEARSISRNSLGSRVAVVNGFSVDLLPTPSIDGVEIVVDVVMRPALQTTFDETLVFPEKLQEHVEKIAVGAASTIMAIPGQPWSNPEYSVHIGAQFSEYIKCIAAKVGVGGMKSRKRNALFY